MPELSIRLDWPGKNEPLPLSRAVLRPVSGGDERFTLITGDNLEALRAAAPRLGAKATLAYLDPPFLTGRRHDRVTRRKDPVTGVISRDTTAAFDDRWESLEHYLGVLAPRIVAARELLAPHGCLVLHIDSKTSHYAKILCDEIFGSRAFASEIVWRYRRWPSKTQNFQRVHDVLLRYVRDPDTKPRFRQLYEPLATSTLATWGDKRQRAVVDEDGRRARSSRTSELTPGTPLGDVWEIGIVAPVARERTGYPTQKPEPLLERLVEACTDPDDLVLDPYVGSGTTAAVAARLGRRVLAIDANPDAIEITRKRLEAAGLVPRCEELVPGPAKVASTRRRAARSAA